MRPLRATQSIYTVKAGASVPVRADGAAAAVKMYDLLTAEGKDVQIFDKTGRLVHISMLRMFVTSVTAAS